MFQDGFFPRSWSLFVGGEAFQIQQMSDRSATNPMDFPVSVHVDVVRVFLFGRTPIFEENSKDVFVCHGSITQKLLDVFVISDMEAGRLGDENSQCMLIHVNP